MKLKVRRAPEGRRSRPMLVAGFLATLAAGIGLVGAPTAAAALAAKPLEFGATYYRGITVTWSARSVHVTGTLRGLDGERSGCRKAFLYAYANDNHYLDDNSTSLVCNQAVPRDLDVTGNVAGGPAYVVIALTNYNGHKPYRSERCTRTACNLQQP